MVLVQLVQRPAVVHRTHRGGDGKRDLNIEARNVLLQIAHGRNGGAIHALTEEQVVQGNLADIANARRTRTERGALLLGALLTAAAKLLDQAHQHRDVVVVASSVPVHDCRQVRK